MSQQKNIALVAHDGKKKALLDWANEHKSILKNHLLYATGSTGKLLEAELDLPIHKLESGPLGGDQQLGAGIVNGEIDALIFFWDPLEAQPHDPDIRALLRIAVVWNIPVACSEVTASIIIRSDFMDKPFKHRTPDYSEYRRRPLRK